MNQEEVKQYIKEHLSVKVQYWQLGQRLDVMLMLDNEPVSVSSIQHFSNLIRTE